MAGKQIAGEGLPANIAGMSKNQLYDIVSQMKILIEQNHQQARQILIQNPPLTKALFQAQIMLGMVKPPQVIPTIPLPASQHPQQSVVQPPSQTNIQPAQTFPGQVGSQDQAVTSQTQPPIRKQHQNQTVTQISSAAVPTANLQSQPMPHSLQTPQQTKGHLNPPMTVTQSSQLPNVPPLPLHSSSQPPHHQMPTANSQLQQPLQTTGIPHMPLQPSMPPQGRPPSMPNYNHHYAPQMGPSAGFQHPGGPHHPSQPMFHSGNKPPALGHSFPQGQLPLPNQPPPQSMYQNQAGGLHLGSEFGNQVGGPMQSDRGSSWMSNQPDNSTLPQLQGPSPPVPSQMGPGNQPVRPGSLTPEMEKALLQQVMSLTPEQINLLPPEQRDQVISLQRMLRQ